MINNDRINIIQNKIKSTLLEIEKEENIKISFSPCSFNRSYYKTEMKIFSIQESNSINEYNEMLSKKVGFTQNVVGMEFMVAKKGGEVKAEIIDIHTKNRKYPVIVKYQDGSVFKFTVSHAKKLIGGDKIINRNVNIDKLFD